MYFIFIWLAISWDVELLCHAKDITFETYQLLKIMYVSRRDYLQMELQSMIEFHCISSVWTKKRFVTFIALCLWRRHRGHFDETLFEIGERERKPQRYSALVILISEAHTFMSSFLVYVSNVTGRSWYTYYTRIYKYLSSAIVICILYSSYNNWNKTKTIRRNIIEAPTMEM